MSPPVLQPPGMKSQAGSWTSSLVNIPTRRGGFRPAVFRVALLTCLVPGFAGCSGVPERPAVAAARETLPESALQRFGSHVASDLGKGYSGDGLLALLPHVGVHAVLANSKLDREIRDKWQEDWRGERSDRLAESFIDFGDYAQNRYSLPFYTLTMLVSGYSGDATQDSDVATWAERSMRANILGGPQAWGLTYALGTHRPDTGKSDWQPWNDNDGVSGHSFYGAVPFLTAARMTDNRSLRYTLFVLSTFPGLARIHDDHHYSSQAYLGWAIAWRATQVVAGEEPEGLEIMALPRPGGGVEVVLTGHF